MNISKSACSFIPAQVRNLFKLTVNILSDKTVFSTLQVLVFLGSDSSTFHILKGP